MICGCGRTLTEADKTGATSYVCPACGKVIREEATTVWGGPTASAQHAPTRSTSITVIGVIDLVLAALAIGLAAYIFQGGFEASIPFLISGLLYLLGGVAILARQARWFALLLGLYLVISGILALLYALGMLAGPGALRPPPLSIVNIVAGCVPIVLGLVHWVILGGEDTRLEFAQARETRRRKREVRTSS